MDIYLFSGTHWDREWYQTFQGFRFKLVKMLNELIISLETDPDYGVFHLDGQTIVLEDYYQIMPENKARMEKLIKDGKIIIGPWYCMPDEFLLSGESLIKNLQRGFKIARQHGVEPLKYGYICDIFGHIAQMPQIFKQMGIDYALIGRGTNEHTTDMHFLWEALDGSMVTTFKLQDMYGYADFSCHVLHREEDTRDLSDEEVTKRIKELTDGEIKRSNVPIVLLMDAIDHAFYHPDTSRYLRVLKELYPDANIHHTSVMDMCCKLSNYIDKLPVRKGELNETGRIKADFIALLTNTLSSRYPLKKANDKLQTLLERWISPLYAFNMVDLPMNYLDLANQYLLKNHPHDSICGCSVDQVHKDMEYRFDQAEMICGQIIDEYKMSIRVSDGENQLIKVVNPLPYKDKRVIEVMIEFDMGYPEKYLRDEVNSFKILDFDGNEIPYGIVSLEKARTKRIYNQHLKTVDLYNVVFEAELEPMSIKEYSVVPYVEASRYLSTLKQTETSAENEHIMLEINNNGSINILDKATGREYKNLLNAIDDGEMGDGWFHVTPPCDKVVTNTIATIEKVENNVNRITFKVVQTLMLPSELIRDNVVVKRNENYIPFEIKHYITLAKGEKWVSVKTVINNNVKDHRLRIKLPTGILGDKYYANQPFCFVERKTDFNIDTQNWREPEVPEKQMSGIVLKKDESGGFAFISKYGLHECAASENGDITVTLFRSFKRTVMNDGEITGQLLKELEFEFILMPFDYNTSLADIQKRQDVLQSGIMVVNCIGKKAENHKPIMSIDSNSILLSTANKTDKGAEIRVYNMSENKGTAIIKLPENTVKAYYTDLDGHIEKELDVKNGIINIELDKWQFKTIGFEE